MTRLLATLLALAASARLALAAIPDTDQPASTAPVVNMAPSGAAIPPPPAKPKPAAKPAAHPAAPTQSQAEMQAALDQLTQTNHELLDLLKKQQAVLEDMQFDRRLQSRQIASLESRLEEALADKRELEHKISQLEMQISLHPVAITPGTTTTSGYVEPPVQTTSHDGTIVGKPIPSAPPTNAPVDTPPPPPPETYLPPAPNDAAQGAPGWHRLFTLKGSDSRQTDVFLVHGTKWRVVWHNQDKPGKMYANTSALFINAFPRDDTIPQKISAKLGSGGDATELPGPGNYYLKIEASGGDWELAVEEYR